MKPQSMASIVVEVPVELLEYLQIFLTSHSKWTQEGAFTAALCLFLLQNFDEAYGQRVAKMYIAEICTNN